MHGTDGVRTLSNLAILTGKVGTEGGCGVILRGQNNVQGASDIGSLPDLLPGYQKVADQAARERFEQAWGVSLAPEPGLRIPQMFNAAIDGELKALYVFGEDIMQTDPDTGHVQAALDACELVISQEIFLSRTAERADVVLPAASFLEKDGTFVNFDRRFQRVRPALEPPGDAKTDFEIIHLVARALGADLGCRTPADAMDECARLAPLFGGISHARLDREGALHWPCRSESDPGEATLYLHGFATPNGRAQLAARPYLPPGEEADAAYPYTLITGRRLEHDNAGTMTRRTANGELVSEERLEAQPRRRAAARRERRRAGRGEQPARVDHRRRRGHRTRRPGPGVHGLPFPRGARQRADIAGRRRRHLVPREQGDGRQAGAARARRQRGGTSGRVPERRHASRINRLAGRHVETAVRGIHRGCLKRTAGARSSAAAGPYQHHAAPLVDVVARQLQLDHARDRRLASVAGARHAFRSLERQLMARLGPPPSVIDPLAPLRRGASACCRPPAPPPCPGRRCPRPAVWPSAHARTYQ